MPTERYFAFFSSKSQLSVNVKKLQTITQVRKLTLAFFVLCLFVYLCTYKEPSWVYIQQYINPILNSAKISTPLFKRQVFDECIPKFWCV